MGSSSEEKVCENFFSFFLSVVNCAEVYGIKEKVV